MEFYTELTKKQYKKILNGELSIEIPHGVKMKNRKGSRGLFFECTDKSSARELIKGLQLSGMAWQGDEERN